MYNTKNIKITFKVSWYHFRAKSLHPGVCVIKQTERKQKDKKYIYIGKKGLQKHIKDASCSIRQHFFQTLACLQTKECFQTVYWDWKASMHVWIQCIHCCLLIFFKPAYIYIYTVGTESIQTPLNFSLFVILQPFAKSFKFIFFPH